VSLSIAAAMIKHPPEIAFGWVLLIIGMIFVALLMKRHEEWSAPVIAALAFGALLLGCFLALGLL